MEIVFVASALRDVEDAAAWWEANRPDAPGLITAELREGAARLAHDAAILPVFRRVGDLSIRRLHLPRTRRHLYLVIQPDRVVVLAVWGSVRGLLPRLRARAAESR